MPSSRLKRISLSSVATLNHCSSSVINWRQLIPYWFIKGKVIGSSLVLPEENEEHIKNYPARYSIN